MPMRAAVAVMIVTGTRGRIPVRPVFIFHTALLQLVAIDWIAISVPGNDLSSIVIRLRRHRHCGEERRNERGNA